MVNVALLEIPDDVPTLTEVARIALRHSQLTRVMRLAIKDADRSRGWSAKESMKVTSRTRFGKLLEKVRKLVTAASAENPFDELDALLSRIETATKDRNHILHSLWASHRGRSVIEDDEGIEEPPSLPELRRAANVLAKLVTDLNESRLRGDLAKVTGRPVKPRAIEP